ncbi:MAG TPA: hypothetical protein DDX54_02505 [Rhodospirillaceae bacterium]|jgi:predicted lipid-binding transport protein (Tim44 family)|nr:Tim44 domain-containing protein [Alphaproteobacteria bacterium]HBH26256.1 hypothetical protein [Rhodospirillaceae bacterium]
MSADIVILAAVAVALAAWLHRLLGTRHGAERERVHPLVAAEERKAALEAQKAGALGDQEAQEVEVLLPGMAVDPAAREGLTAIGAQERGFSVRAFLTAAADTFALVTEDFAKGDIEGLQDLLAPPVAEAFAQAVRARAQRGETQEAEVRAVLESEVVEAGVQGRTARVVVRFVAEQVGTTRDATGTVVAGDPARIARVEARWAFVRRLGDPDPRWWVAETGG